MLIIENNKVKILRKKERKKERKSICPDKDKGIKTSNQNLGSTQMNTNEMKDQCTQTILLNLCLISWAPPTLFFSKINPLKIQLFGKKHKGEIVIPAY